MALHSPSSTPRRDLGLCDSPPADSQLPISQGGSGNGARKMKEVEHMLSNLEKEGVQINAKIASIIVDEVAIIKAEAARENINERIRIEDRVIDTILSIAVGFMMGVQWYEDAFNAARDKILFRK